MALAQRQKHDLPLAIIGIISLVMLDAVLWATPEVLAESQTELQAKADYVFKSWGIENGLPQNSVFALEQTSDGYLWVGTLQGLARFDGSRFTVFEGGNTEGLPHARITNLMETENGDLWIATAAHGLNRYRQGKFTALTTEHGLPDNSLGPLGAMAEYPANVVWVATNQGLIRIQNGRVIPTHEIAGAPTEAITAILADKQHKLWVGTNSGLSCLQNGQWQNYTPADGLLNAKVRSIYQASDGSIWIGFVGGVSRIKNNQFQSFEIPEADILHIIEDSFGHLWICASGLGLLEFTDQKFRPIEIPDEPLGRAVTSIVEDQEGSLWVGTNGNGLHRLHKGLFATFEGQSDLPGQMAHGIYEDKSGALWVASFEGGVTRFFKGETRTFTVTDGLPSNRTWTIAEDDQGSLLVGTDLGLAKLDKERFELIGEMNLSVYCLLRETSGDLLVGTDPGAVFRYSAGQLTPILELNQLVGSGTILALHKDHHGTLWIGTRGGGLFQFYHGKLTSFTTRDGLSHNTVRTIDEQPDGNLWIGTYGGGICALNIKEEHPQLIRTLEKDQGLPDNTIHAIVHDDNGMTWLSSNKGIFRISDSDLTLYFSGEIDHLRPDHFTSADGMPSSECNGGFQPAHCQTQDGRIWFPTTEGPTGVNPSQTQMQSLDPPPVYVEELVVDGVLADLAENLELAPGADRLQFRYTGLLLGKPEKLVFRYRLVGHDPDWIEADKSRSAVYTSLPPRPYVFRVQTSLGSTEWSKAAELSFRIRPHFQHTIWFRSLMIILLLSSAASLTWALSKRRHRKALRQAEARQALEQERVRISRDMHDEVGASLTEIALLSELTRLQNPTAEITSGNLDKIAHKSRLMLDSIGEIIWAINPQNDQLDLVCPYLREYTADYLENTSIRAVLSFPENLHQLEVSAEFRRNLFLILKEALHNVVKHSQANQVQVTLSIENRNLELIIEDDGRGFPGSQSPGGGLGLNNMHHRAGEVGGHLEISSIPSRGTKIHFKAALVSL